ncbi:MAG: glycosyl transferase family 36, partial [Bacteroidota bacterium]
MNRLFETEAGYFTPDGSEFVITTPRTPRPWANVVSNGDTGFIVSQAGGGYSWRTNAQVNRITRWEQDVIKDEWGKFLYLQDLESGSVWSAAWKPVCEEPEHYEVRYGAGYATFVSRLFGIESTWTMFIPVDDPVEVWRLTVRNRSRRRRRLRLMTYMEWCLGAAPDWHREFHKCFIETSYDRSHNALVATKRLWEVPSHRGHWNTSWPYVAFHSSSVKPVSYDCSKENVLGLYGTVQRPQGLRLSHLPKETGNLRDPVASLELELVLKPGEERVMSFTLGAAETREEMRVLTSRYHSISAVDKALQRVKERWNELLGATSVDTPDPSLNLLLNRWLVYQAIAGRLWGRNGYYQAGGAFGYRDQLQDSQIFLPIDPQLTRNQILLHARHQFKDGTVHHWWHPLSEVGLTTSMTDDLLWLPFLVHAYIEETADTGLLNHDEPFIDDQTAASVYDHCVRAIERVLARFSPRGLPLLGAGDWNDGVNAAGIAWKGESVWLGQFLYAILRSFSGIAAEHGDRGRQVEFMKRADSLRLALNDHGWDGEWYFYGTKDDGQKIGSRENAAGRIHLNPQTWAVIADVADADRARAVMDRVMDLLEFKAGPVLLHPAYSVPDEGIGYLTRYAPGTRE